LVEEKQLAAYSAILRALFSGVVFCRPKDVFSLVFSSEAPIRMSQPTRQHLRIYF
jgi:hypothetical protein